MARIYAYCRVSTGEQDANNQRLGIYQFAQERGWKIHEFVDEIISGTVSYKKRRLGKLIEDLKEEEILIVSELSRLGRSMLEVITLLSELTKKGVKVYAIKGGYSLDGTLQSKILGMILCMAAEIERELISQRTKESLNRRKLQGFTLGRPKGRLGTSKLSPNLEEIKRLYKNGVSIQALCNLFKCSWPTMKNFIDKIDERVKMTNAKQSKA